MTIRSTLLLTLVLPLASAPATAQAPIPYGAPINLEQARKLIAAAEAEAAKQKWPVAIAIVDGSGHLVAFARMDNTQLGSIEVALEKAKCAALFRRPTKLFEEALVMGGANLRVLKAPGIIPIEGGLPIIHDGKVIGAIGVSGVKANEDGQVAQAGIDAFKKP
ncbi:MAG: heme-binding protein [Gemmataceae bacterium]|nr:heme-binding protein [Gemmataceae bacterium]